MTFSLIRRAARGIRYRTLSEILNLNITFTDRLAISSTSTQLVNQFFPGSTFLGPPQKMLDGQIIKYGLLDLEFSTAPSLLGDYQSGVPLLRELGLMGKTSINDDWNNPMEIVEMVLEDLAESHTYLKLFLRASDQINFDMRGQLLGQVNPSSLSFPMTFTIQDACITNVSSAWMMKHFYL